jgi:TonB-dependent starch-binding outer membrane protein SusC
MKMKPYFLAGCLALLLGTAGWAEGAKRGGGQSSPQPELAPRATLRQVLEQLRKQYKVKILVEEAPVLDSEVAREALDFRRSLTHNLDQLLRPLGYRYQLVKGTYIIKKDLAKPALAEPSPAKTGQLPPGPEPGNDPGRGTEQAVVRISGKVTSAEDGQPMPGVNIVVVGTITGTITDVNGNYSFNVPEGATLEFSYIGFKSQRVVVGSQTELNIVMQPDVSQLREVVVVGYGERTKAEVSGAVTQVDSRVLTRQPITSFEQGLVGQVPGMSIRQGTGSPGAGPEILIRGVNSLGNNAPLIVIDGFIFGNYNSENNNLLTLFNPEDIETVSVLKDAESKAIYGSRASGGVIMITTKKGKVGKPKISFTSAVGIQGAMGFERPNVMNANELAQFRKEVTIDNIRRQQPALYGDPAVPVPDALIPEAFRNPAQYGAGTDWYGEITRRAPTQSHNVSISGGNENVKYFISGNYQEDQGIVINTWFKRFSFRSNVDYKITEKLRGGLNLNPSRSVRNNPFLEPGSGQFSAYSTIASTYWADPSAPVRDANGNLTPTTQGTLTQFYTRNPVFALQEFKRETYNLNNLLGTYLEYEPIKNLVLKTTLTYRNSLEEENTFRPSTFVADGLTPPFPNIGGASSGTFSSKTESLLSETTAAYRLAWQKHRVDLLAGWTVQDTYIRNVGINASRLLDEAFLLPSSGNTDRSNVNNFTGSQGYSDFRFLGVVSKLNYVYADKYLLNLSLRRDASSRFGPDNRWATFPAISGAWRISEEPFLKGHPIISELRLEAGYGISGNAASVGNYDFQGDVNAANYVFGGQQATGFALAALPNFRLTWEEQQQTDVGIKAGFYDNRASFSLNLFRQITDGALVGVGVPNTVGYGSIVGNLGSIQNQGFELDLNGTVLQREGLRWTTTFNVSHYRNKILSLVNNAPFFGAFAGNSTPVVISRVGSPIGMIQGLRIVGNYTAEEIGNPAVPKYPNAVVGGYKFEDGNGDGAIQLGLADYVDLANPHPDLLLGWTNQFTYGKLSVRTVMSGQVGGYILDLRNELLFNVDGVFNVTRQLQDRFRPGDVPGEAAYPGTQGDTRALRFPSTQHVFSATHVGLRNLTVGYNLTSLVNKKKKMFDNLDVYFSGRNLFFLSAYKRGNPEVRRAADGSQNRAVNYGSYPIAFNLTFGLNVTF